MFVAVSYDIVNNRTRSRLAKIISNFGSRVQKSVFECRIEDQQYLKMKEHIEKEIDHEEDSVRYYFLCAKCSGNIQVSGWGAISEDEDVLIV
jgi:CRISPR-associated protein Cas2